MHLDELVARWVDGWALCRVSPYTRVHGGWRVELAGSAHRTRETVLVGTDPATFTRYAEELVGTDGTWLSVITPTPRTWTLPAGTTLQWAEETVMTTALTTALTGSPSRGTSDPRVQLDVSRAPAGTVARAELWLEGRAAAVGVIGVRGAYAVVDRVRTLDAFQGRGLGTAVMTTLTSWALEQGADTGLLVASTEGRSLYERLGWTPVATMTTVRGA